LGLPITQGFCQPSHNVLVLSSWNLIEYNFLAKLYLNLPILSTGQYPKTALP
jgi:hypothetical protein